MIARLVYSPVMRSGDTLAPRHLLLVDNLFQDYGIREQVLSGFGSSLGAQFLSFFFVCLFVCLFRNSDSYVIRLGGNKGLLC